MSEPRVFASVVQPLVAYAEALGLARADVLALSELAPEALRDPDALVPYEPLVHVWRAITEAFPGIPLGARYASLISLDALGVVGYVLRHAKDGHAALALTLRFSRLIDPFMRVVVENDAGLVTVRVEHEPRVVALREPIEMLVLAMVRMATSLVAESARAEEIVFRHPRMHPSETYRDVVGQTPVRFDASHDGVVFSSALLDLPMASADPRVATYLAKHAEAVLETVGGDVDLPIDVRVRRVALAALSGGEIEAAVVAKSLGRSVRTLQRELQEHGTTLSDLVDEVRKEQALVLLGRPPLSVAEVAFMLGYSDARVFYRSFRRWTGMTPTEFRRAR